MATKTKNQATSNFDLLFGATPDARNGRPIAGLMLLDPNIIETGEQPRTQFDATGISELANSIQERREKNEGVEGTGILQPLLVASPETGVYRLVAGERRLRAARKLKLPFVPVVLVPDNPRERLISQLVENLQRANLNPLEEARALDAWMKSNKFSVRDAAAAIGKDKNYISNRLRLLKMGEDVQEMVSQRADALIHAQLIEGVGDAERRRKLLQTVIEDGVSVAELRRLIHPADTESQETKVSLRRDEEAKASLHRDKKFEVSLHRDEDIGAPKEEGIASNSSGKTSIEAEVSLRRDTSASTPFSIQVEALQAANSLLTSLKTIAEWQPGERMRLRSELAALSQSLTELEAALTD